ncbi:MAG: DapH/DapD/GlmU-related protein [Thermomicrobiales bacterium]
MVACGCDDQRWRRTLRRRQLLAALGGGALVLGQRATGRAQEATPLAGELIRISQPALGALANGSYISPMVELYGDVDFGAGCFVASNTIFEAISEHHITVGNHNNCQDNAYLIAQEADLIFGDRVSVAHQAALWNSEIGDFTFFGFRSRVHDSVIGEGSMIMHNTTVIGVTIPPNRITPMGVIIDSQEIADALPELVEANVEFKEDVQGVNEEFASGYSQLLAEYGLEAVTDIGPNPITSWNPDMVEPTLGDGVQLAELVRVVGDVRLGERSRVGQRSAIRADEGTPIEIGRNARLGARVTFHALLGTSITVGDNASIGDECVLHGPLTVGNNLTVEAGSVLFRATVEDNVTLRRGCTVAAEVVLREGTIVPEGVVVDSQEVADSLPTR